MYSCSRQADETSAPRERRRVRLQRDVRRSLLGSVYIKVRAVYTPVGRVLCKVWAHVQPPCMISAAAERRAAARRAKEVSDEAIETCKSSIRIIAATSAEASYPQISSDMKQNCANAISSASVPLRTTSTYACLPKLAECPVNHSRSAYYFKLHESCCCRFSI